MKYNKLAIVFGVLFGLGLLPLAYLNLFVGLVLAFSGGGDFTFMIFVFAALGLMTIIGACFAIKNIWVPRVISTLSCLALLGTIIYLVVNGVMSNILFLIAYVVVLLLGIFATIFAWMGSRPAQKIAEN